MPASALYGAPATIVYFAPQMRAVAEELAAGEAAGHVVLREIEWRSFADGFPDLFIKDVKSVRWNAVLFLASFDTPAAVFQQLPVIYTLPAYGAKRLTVCLPWFPTGTMERIDEVGQVPTGASLAKMLSATPLAANGPVTFVVLDIHSLAEQFYFGDS